MSGPRLSREGRKVAKNLLDMAKVAGVSPVLRVRLRALGVGVEFAAQFLKQGVNGLPALPIGVRRRGRPGLIRFAHLFSPAVIYRIHRLHVGGKSSPFGAAGNGLRRPFPANHPIPGGLAPRGATLALVVPNGGPVHV